MTAAQACFVVAGLMFVALVMVMVAAGRRDGSPAPWQWWGRIAEARRGRRITRYRVQPAQTTPALRAAAALPRARVAVGEGEEVRAR